MVKFLIVRHGHSVANEQSIFAGITDVALSKIGEQQAEAVSNYILNNHQIDAIYSSQLSRAKNTIKKVSESLNEKLAPLNMEVEKIAPTTRYFHFAKSNKDNPLMDKLISKSKEATGRILKPCGSCQSDLSLFIKNGSERAFSFGIGRDFDFYGGAHQADEFIECEKILEFAQIIAAALV